MIDVITLAQKLLNFDTRHPHGHEKDIAEYIGGLLLEYGFQVRYPQLSETQWNVVAEYGLSKSKPPIVLTGHLDTVPLGEKEWSVDPFSGLIRDGKLFGRGSSDMKGAVAAMIVAAREAVENSLPEGGIKLILTASEEVGLKGAHSLVNSDGQLGDASAIIVGEPTANIPTIGHKGAMFMVARTSGVTAHSSMPDTGVNAIYKAARAINKIENYRFDCEDDPLLGMPTINVGQISGGLNPNSVPDWAEFTIDVRTTKTLGHRQLLEQLQQLLGEDVTLDVFVDQAAVTTPETDPFVRLVYEQTGLDIDDREIKKVVPYLTDASVFQNHYQDVPIVILGPGQPEMAHQTDEFCFVADIEKSVKFYHDIIISWQEKQTI